MAPRHTKSEFASYLFPAWMMGRNPRMKIIQATHTTELAVNFGRKTKNLIESEEFGEIFPEVKLAADSKASGMMSEPHILFCEPASINIEAGCEYRLKYVRLGPTLLEIGTYIASLC